MKAKIFYIIMRVKDGLYYHQTDAEGQDWFASDITTSHKFFTREDANTKIRSMQNWLKRPKFRVMTGKTIFNR